MWISEQLAQEKTPGETAQTARVALSGIQDNGGVSAGSDRGVELCAPYGYTFSLPAGKSLILTNCDAKQTAIGVAMQQRNLSAGEIKIESESGGYIYLADNGSVVINGLEINRYGEIVSD